MNRQADLEQPVAPRLDRNILKGNGAAKSFRILLCVEMHVLRLRTGEVIGLADVGLRIDEEGGEYT